MLIPIIKLSTSSHVLSEEFRPSRIFQIICWILAVIVICFDIYLFIQHAVDVRSAAIIGVFAIFYISFLIYLMWKPLENKDVIDSIDGWMSLPQNEDDFQLEEQEADTHKITRNKGKHHATNSRDSSEEIYSL